MILKIRLQVITIFFIFPLFFTSIVCAGTTDDNTNNSLWIKLDKGLYYGEFESTQKSIVGNSKITIIKIDPNFYSFKLLCADELKHQNMTAKQWGEKYGLLGVINAGMFLGDHKSNAGFMKNYGYVNNPKNNSKYFSVAAFNPNDDQNKPFRIFDTDEYEMNSIKEKYSTVIQNLRLIKRIAENRWTKQDKIWSEAALGQDVQGNVLFIFSRSPFSMYDLNHMLINLPIEIVCAQHLEGGPEASLYFSYNDLLIEKNGSYETNFIENDDNEQG